jgi:hypothetical protein
MANIWYSEYSIILVKKNKRLHKLAYKPEMTTCAREGVPSHACSIDVTHCLIKGGKNIEVIVIVKL